MAKLQICCNFTLIGKNKFVKEALTKSSSTCTSFLAQTFALAQITTLTLGSTRMYNNVKIKYLYSILQAKTMKVYIIGMWIYKKLPS